MIINYNNGHMHIFCSRFFPASQKDLRHLLKVIELDHLRKDELLDEICEYCRKKEQTKSESASGMKTAWVNIHQQMTDTKAIVDSRSWPIGLRLTRYELKELKNLLKKLKAEDSLLLKNIRRADRAAKQFHDNFVFLEGYKNDRKNNL